jgi:hypothetical protein
MSHHPYEYKMLVEYLTPIPSTITPHYAEKRDEESLTLALEEVVKHLPDAIDEGWEVNSHGLTVAENTMILSILLRRSRAQ